MGRRALTMTDVRKHFNQLKLSYAHHNMRKDIYCRPQDPTYIKGNETPPKDRPRKVEKEVAKESYSCKMGL